MKWLPGVLVSLGAAAVGWGIHLLAPVIPWLTASLALGVIAGCIPAFRGIGVLKPGLTVSSKSLLRLGIVVLGLKLSLVDIAHLGWFAIVLIVALVGLSFGITYGVARLFRLEGDQPVLLAAGWLIHLGVPVIPWLTASLALGVIAGCVPAFRRIGALKPGLAISSKRLLRLGIVVLGLKASPG